jgi:hypothetical protein
VIPAELDDVPRSLANLRRAMRLRREGRPLVGDDGLVIVTGWRDDLPAFIADKRAQGTAVTLVIDHLESGPAYTLIQAGLSRVRMMVTGPASEREFRAAEKLIAMRDANRKPGPKVELGLVVTDEGALLGLIEVCAHRFTDVEPWVVTSEVPLPEARQAARRAGFRRTVASIDALRVRTCAGGG